MNAPPETISAPWLETSWKRLNASLSKPAPGLLLVSPSTGDAQLLATVWAKQLLCESHEASRLYPCGECRSCREMEGQTHPDFLAVERPLDKKGISIDQIRTAIEWSTKTARQSRRVLHISGAEQMGRSSANAFLKTLEEPSAGLIVILSARQLHSLPITIRSRCQQLVIPRPSKEQFASWLAEHGADAQTRQAAQLVFPGDSQALCLVDQDVSESAGKWMTAWHRGVEQGDTLGAAALLDADDWMSAIAWLQRCIVAWAQKPGAALLLQGAWDLTISTRATQAISMNRLLIIEELLMLLRSAHRQCPVTLKDVA